MHKPPAVIRWRVHTLVLPRFQVSVETGQRHYPHFPSRLDAALHQLDAALQELWSSPKRAA